MIGSAGSNVGKTELACALLRKFGKSNDITGIKVTAIKEKNGQCPRGGKGCGVCSSLEGVYCITEETNRSSGRDTARLLAAGAKRVFWLRVLKDHLAEGVTALLDVIGPETVSIYESNSLRHAVEPGLFLMTMNRNTDTWKDSAQQVKKYADKIVASNGYEFDFDFERIKLTDGKWTLLENATAIIMAGGSSKRMGTDKSMLPISGLPIIERICDQLRDSFEQILISSNEADKLAFLGYKVIPDKEPGQGPLMGIASVLEASSNELNFIVACDIPHIELRYVRKMLAEANESKADIIIPISNEGQHEPLFAIYRKSALKAINNALSSGSRKIADVFPLCNVRYIEFDNADWLTNLNTMNEYEECKTKHGN